MGNCKYTYKGTTYTKEEFESFVKEEFVKKSPENQFLSLLEKDNNWVKFFIRSIIQDSAKKGYEKILFPSGNTASKVEGHTTLEEFKERTEGELIDIQHEIERFNKEQSFGTVRKEGDKYLRDYYLPGSSTLDKTVEITKGEFEEKTIKEHIEPLKRREEQLKQELERVEKEGFAALRPIYNFYENTVTNILKKQGYSPKLVTDEYGNTWNEVQINPERDLGNILLSNPLGFARKVSSIVDSITDSQAEEYTGVKQSDSVQEYINKDSELSTLFKDLSRANPYVTLKFHDSLPSSFDPYENEITIGLKEVYALSQISGLGIPETFKWVISHEMTHAGTAYLMRENKAFQNEVKELYTEFIREDKNRQFVDSLRANHREKGKTYQYDPHEFLADATSNPEFIKYLKNIKVPRGTKSLWQRFISLINRYLGTNFGKVSLYDKLTDLIFNPSYQEENTIGAYYRNTSNVEMTSNFANPQEEELNPDEFPDVDIDIDPFDESPIPEDISDINEDIFNDFDVSLQEFNRSTISDKHKRAIETQFNSLKNLEHQLKGVPKNSDKEKELSKRISLIKGSIERLTTSTGFDVLLYNQQRLVNTANDLLNTANPYDLNYIKEIVGNTGTLVNILGGAQEELSEEQKARLNNLWSSNAMLSERYKVRSTVTLDAVAKGVGFNYQSLNKPYKDIGVFKREGLSIEDSEIPEVQMSAKLLNWRKNKLNEDSEIVSRQIDKFKNETDWKDTVKSFYDEFGRFIVKIKSQYFLSRKEMFDKTSQVLKDSKASKEEKDKAGHEREVWFAKNNDYSLSKEGSEKYLQQERYWLENNTDDTGFYDLAAFEAWKEENSPESYKNWMDTLRRNPKIVLTGVKPKYGWQYLNISPIQEYHYTDPNDKYNRIKNNPLYQFITDTLIKSIQKVPHSAAVDSQDFDAALNNFTIDISSDKFILSDFLKGLGDTFTSWFNSANLSNYQDKLDPSVIKILQDRGFKSKADVFKYYSNRKELSTKTGLNSTQVDNIFKVLDDNPNEISYSLKDSQGNDLKLILIPELDKYTKEANSEHLLDVLNDFYRMALTYEYKADILPLLNVLHDRLNEREAIKVNNRGKIQTDANGKPLTIKEGLKNARDLLLYTIKAEIFNERISDKGSAAQKIFDPLINFTRNVGIMGKPFAGASNALFGFIQNFRWAAKNTDFNDLDAIKAIKILLGSVVKYLSLNKIVTPEAKKVMFLVHKFGGPEFEVLLKEGSDTNTKFKKIMYTFITSGEYLVHAHALISMLNHTKIKDLQGNERPLWDYYLPGEYGLQYNHKEFGVLENWESVQKGDSDLNKMMDRFKEYRKSTQGDYFNAIKGKETTLGRSLFIFKTWLPQFVYNRFGQEQPELGTKGSYLSYIDLFRGNINRSGTIGGVAKSLGMLAGHASLLIGGNKTFEKYYKEMGLSQVDIENLRMNIRELRMMAFFLVLALLMKRWDDDDDSPTLNVLVNLSQRAFYDLSFFYLPNSTANIIRNPIPLYNTYQNFANIVTAGANYLSGGDDTYDSGPWKDHSKLGVSLLKGIPGFSTIPNSLGVMDQKFSSTAYKHVDNQ